MPVSYTHLIQLRVVYMHKKNLGNGGEGMLAETVKSIRQTEEQAAQIAKEADTCYWALIEQAKENAAQFRSCLLYTSRCV